MRGPFPTSSPAVEKYKCKYWHYCRPQYERSGTSTDPFCWIKYLVTQSWGFSIVILLLWLSLLPRPLVCPSHPSMPIPGDQISYNKLVPCALKTYLQTSSHSHDLSKISTKERELAFQHWVAYNLSSQSYLYLDGHFKCPLIACSNTEASFESCLSHLSSCPRLSNSWYWCPSCEKAEQFAQSIPVQTGISIIGPASRIVDFVTSSIPKSPSAKSTTGGIWKHVTNKLSFLSHPPRVRNKTMAKDNRIVKDNTMGKAELDGGPESVHEKNIEDFAHVDGLNGSPATSVAEKDGLPVQRFAQGDDGQFAAPWFSPKHLFTAELGSTHLAELHDSQPGTGFNPKYSELSADDPFQFIEAAASKKTSMLAYPEPRFELSTHANDGHPVSGHELQYSYYQTDAPHHDHLPPYQIKTFGSLQETQELRNRPFISPESTTVLLGGLTYSTPIEMPATMPELRQSRLTDGRRSHRSYDHLLVPGHPSLSSDQSDPQDSLQHTNYLQNQEMDRPPSYQWPLPRHRLDDDSSLEQVRSHWYLQTQALQSGHIQRTATTNRQGAQAGCRNHSDDSHFVSPLGSPDLYSLSEHSHIVSPSAPDVDRGIPGDQRSSLDSSNLIGASKDPQTLDVSESFNPSSSPELNDVHQPEARLRTSPASSLSERYSLPSSGPSTSAASSHRDSIRSNKSSFSFQVTSTETSLVSPSSQNSFDFTAAPQALDLQEISLCPKCSSESPTKFRGQYRKSNLKRHIRDCHGEKKKILCPVNGCNMSSRSDNVLKHRREVHHDGTPKRSNALRKKRNV